MFVLMLFKLIFRAGVDMINLSIWILRVLKVRLGRGWQVDEGFVSIIKSSFMKFVMVCC
jgi:hypothetical protein